MGNTGANALGSLDLILLKGRHKGDNRLFDEQVRGRDARATAGATVRAA